MKTDERITTALQNNLAADVVEVTDDSWKHRGHTGPKAGEGHFSVRVVSTAFEGKSLVERHRLVYAALAGEMQFIHALAIEAVTPEHQGPAENSAGERGPDR